MCVYVRTQEVVETESSSTYFYCWRFSNGIYHIFPPGALMLKDRPTHLTVLVRA